MPSSCQRLVGNLLEPDIDQRLSVREIFEDEWFSSNMGEYQKPAESQPMQLVPDMAGDM